MALSLRVSGSSRQYILDAGRELVLGSASDCDVVVRDPTVSRHHASLRIEGGLLHIVDLGSRNGTRLDGNRLQGSEAATAAPGCLLAFGELQTRLCRIDDDDADVVLELPTAAVSLPRAAATLPAASLDRFTSEALPRLLDALVAEVPTLEFARALGEALAAQAQSGSVRIAVGAESAAEDATVFEYPGSESDETVVRSSTADFEIQLGIPADQPPQSTRALLRIAAALLALTGAPATAAAATATAVDNPLQPQSLDPVVQRIYRRAARAARAGLNVLIRGESGTGKELLARYLHACSGAASSAFVALNCAALPESLLEAELFGIEKGTATGVDARAGVFERADGGTLFLDEIGDMAPTTQARILRVLQEREVVRLGGTRARSAQVRVVSATHRDIDRMLSEGSFRLDLLHRIADWEVCLPPLRERVRDIGNLAVHFLSRAATARGIGIRGLSRRALSALESYSWPGNIRELEREMARIAAFVDHGAVITTEDLRSELRQQPRSNQGSLDAQLAQAERTIIERVLASCADDVARAADLLKVSRATLYRRIAAWSAPPGPPTG